MRGRWCYTQNTLLFGGPVIVNKVQDKQFKALVWIVLTTRVERRTTLVLTAIIQKEKKKKRTYIGAHFHRSNVWAFI